MAIHNGVLRVADQTGRDLAVAHRQNPIHAIAHHFIGDDEDIEEDVPVFRPNLRTPAVPSGYNRMAFRPTDEDLARSARALVEAGRTEPPTLVDTITAAGGFLQGAGSLAQGIGTIAGAVAQPAAQGLVAVTPPLARGAGRLAMGTLRGGLSVTSHTARGVHSALQRLAQLGMPVEARAERFREGINVADGFGRLMANQYIH